MIQDSYGPHIEHGSSRDDSAGHSNDLLRRTVQITLAIYLLPALLVVLAVGGLACVIETMKSMIQSEGARGRFSGQVSHRTAPRVEASSQPDQRRSSPALQPSLWSKSTQRGRLMHRLDSLAWGSLQGRRSRS